MKMTKKFIFAALAVAAVMGFASCKKQVGDIDWKDKGTGDGTLTFSVEQTNEGDSTIRGMIKANTLPRAQATCAVRQFDQTNKTCDGMVGFATFVTENKTDKTAENYDTMNFLVVGVRNNKGKTQTYASYYCNIKKDALSTKNFGAEKTLKAFDANETKPFEVVIEDLPKDGVQNLDAKIDDKNTLTVAIEFTSNKDGTIDIKWYDKFKTMDASTTLTPEGDAVKGVKATNAQLGTSTTGTKNGYIYAYANVYAGKTLKGQWDIYNVSWTQAGYADEDNDLPEFAGDIIFK